MEISGSSKQPTLEFSVKVQESSVTVEYRVKNTTDGPIYLFNVLQDMDAIDAVAPYPFYVCLRDDKTIVIAKRILPLPQLASVEFRDIPWVTKVEPGAEYVGSGELGLPIDEINSYFPKLDSSQTEPATSEFVQFEIQFIRQIEGLEIKPSPIDGANAVWHRDLFGNVETIVSQPRPLALNIRRRVDAFEGF